MPFVAPDGVIVATPLEAVVLGALAGLFATCVLSLLIRLAPWVGDLTIKRIGPPRARRRLPDASDRVEVRAWQDRIRSPAAHPREPEPQVTTPEGALVTDHGPGPEGAAERFAAKVAAGLFNRDLLQYEKLAGKVVHFSYGSAWGAVYGILQASLGWTWFYAGVVHGVLVWLVGPVALVPAMKVMLGPRDLGWFKTVFVLAGHVVYGLTVALLFMWCRTERWL